MSEASRLLKPLVFHFQKLGFELKCPICLNLLKKPIMLPCNHIFCNECVPGFSRFSTQCPECQQHFTHLETRPASHTENILAIYESLGSTFNSAVLPLLSADSRSLDSISASVDQSRKKLKVAAPKGQTLHSDVYGASGIDSSKCSASEELDMNHATGMSPGSSPSSGGDSKDAEAPNSKLGSKRGATKIHGVKRPVGENLSKLAGELNDKDAVQTRESKRLKKLDYGLPDAILQRPGCSQKIVSHSNQAAVSNCKEECKSKEDVTLTSSVAPCDTSYVNESACAFCHSSELTEGSGPLQHFADGKEVERGANAFFQAIHVHTKCITWTPKVYFVGETIKNLKSELARASKLKCSSCGLKGAALGCFVTSCKRSYHVPCAFEIPGCRWDCDDFLMLCPAHKSTKFPSEKSKTREDQSEQKCSVHSQNIPGQGNVFSEIFKHESGAFNTTWKKFIGVLAVSKHNFWANSPNGPQEWVLCGSSLSSEDKFLLVKFASICGATVFKFWNPNVTHVVASTNSDGACTRTLKVLMAILNGRWILTMDWIKACVEANGYVDEEPYEVNLDNHGCCDGAKTGRLRASNNDPKLFHGLSFYFSGDFVPSSKSDLLDLVRVGGGIVINNMEPRVEQKHDQQPISVTFVVYNNEFPLGSMANAATVFKRLFEAEDVAKDVDARVAPHTWILESIAACRVLPIPLC